MAAHIVVDLAGKTLHRSSVEMKGDRFRSIAACVAVRQQSIPKLRIPRTASLANIEAFVEKPYALEHLATKGHTGAGAYIPGREESMRLETQTVEVLLTVALPKPPIGLELPLRLGRQFRRKHESRYGTDLWRVKCGYQILEPVWMK